MRLTRTTLIRIAVLSLCALVVGALGVLLYVHCLVQGMKAHWGSLDYNVELPSESAVLRKIIANLRPTIVPASARHPKMYRTAGRGPDYYMGFTVDPYDLDALVSLLDAYGYRRVPSGLDDLPHDPPPAVKPWWPGPDTPVMVFRAGEGSRGAWYILSQKTGEVWVYTSRGTYPWPEEKRPK